MAIIDYEIVENLQLSIEEICQVFNMQKSSVTRSLNSKTSFFSIDRLIQLYKWFIRKNDDRANTAEEKLQKTVGYFPIVRLEEFIMDLQINIGLLITDGTSNFIDLIIAHDKFIKLGIITNSAKLMSIDSPRVTLEWASFNHLVSVDYFIYNEQSSPSLKAVMLVGNHIYKLKPVDTEKLFGKLD